MNKDNPSCYELFPGSRLSWLGDNSGIAIYNGYNGDTQLLSAMVSEDGETLSHQVHSPFTIDDLMHWLNLNRVQAQHTIEQLKVQHVVREKR
ncbi:hypothetical protein GCM10009114_25710 [Aliiglaciecola litoralis]|uniref:Uncharacterized protein n=1 Tax=Aliiglaciecola litoralis TaxID=582857 RepID=A0ABP3WWY4_9ALTE